MIPKKDALYNINEVTTCMHVTEELHQPVPTYKNHLASCTSIHLCPVPNDYDFIARLFRLTPKFDSLTLECTLEEALIVSELYQYNVTEVCGTQLRIFNSKLCNIWNVFFMEIFTLPGMRESLEVIDMVAIIDNHYNIHNKLCKLQFPKLEVVNFSGLLESSTRKYEFTDFVEIKPFVKNCPNIRVVDKINVKKYQKKKKKKNKNKVQ